MNFLEFIISILWIISIDSLFGFLLFIVWKYFDGKYFSTFEIETLKEENNYLKKENKKIGGSSSFWKEDNL